MSSLNRTIGSLFAGIGGLELGLEEAGLGATVWQVENDTKCQRVLERHWPKAKRYDDVRTACAHNLCPVWLICGGFPCQDVSAAGKGAGLKEGTRSGLWFEYRRIVGELKPKWVVVENVASGKKRWLPTVRRDLHLLGYDSAAIGLSAADVGAPHLRRRIFVIAHPYGAELREQQGRSEGAPWSGAGLAPDHGVEGPVADAYLQRQLQQEGSIEDFGERNCDRGLAGHTWAVEPRVGRVAHGVPHRMDRLKQLGNAVVPQCAYAVGRLICDLSA